MSRLLYFAYGSNLDYNQMRRRCPGAKVVSRAKLPGFRLAFTRFSGTRRCGVADIIESAQDAVEGVVYSIGQEDAERLDRFEGVGQACYDRIDVSVFCPDGQTLNAFAYKAREQGEFLPSRAYLNQIIDGARRHRLSPEYIAMLEALQADR